MSIRVMALVSDRFDGGGSDLLAMIMLADWCADDGGSLYPSVAHLAAKMRVSESQARRVLHGLIDAGFVNVVGNAFGGAPGATRIYRLNVEKLHAMPILPAIAKHLDRNRSRGGDETRETASMDATPSADATPSTDARDGSHGCARRVARMCETASAHASLTTMNHQRTVIDPSGKAKPPRGDDSWSRHVTVADLVAEGVDREHAADWLAVRKTKKAPLTGTAWAGTKREAEKAGLSPAQAVEMAAERGWAGFRASFLDQSHHAPSAKPPQRASRPERFDPTAFVNRNRPTENERSSHTIDI